MHILTKLSNYLARRGPTWWINFWANIAHRLLNRAAPWADSSAGAEPKDDLEASFACDQAGLPDFAANYDYTSYDPADYEPAADLNAVEQWMHDGQFL